MNSFDDLMSFFRTSERNLEQETKKASKQVASDLKKYVKWLHWKQLPWFPPINTNKTPLLDTGKLRGAVYWEANWFSWKVTTKMQKLWKIHEYWRYWKMTDKQRRYLFAVVFKNQRKAFVKKYSGKKGYIRIPARPLWRYAENSYENIPMKILENVIAKSIR